MNMKVFALVIFLMLTSLNTFAAPTFEQVLRMEKPLGKQVLPAMEIWLNHKGYQPGAPLLVEWDGDNYTATFLFVKQGESDVKLIFKGEHNTKFTIDSLDLVD